MCIQHVLCAPFSLSFYWSVYDGHLMMKRWRYHVCVHSKHIETAHTPCACMQMSCRLPDQLWTYSMYSIKWYILYTCSQHKPQIKKNQNHIMTDADNYFFNSSRSRTHMRTMQLPFACLHVLSMNFLTCFGFILAPLISLGYICARLHSSFLVATADLLRAPDTDQ